MAGGSLVTKLAKGFREIRDAGLVDGASPRLFGAQADGCAPIVRAVEQGSARPSPVVPSTVARSLAIGNPADGPTAIAAIRASGGWAASVSDTELVAGIRLLANTAGVFTETAGGVTTAVAQRLSVAGFLRPDDEVVLCITGNGLKTVETVAPSLEESPVIAARLRDVAALADAA
jgi:threonine synthase